MANRTLASGNGAKADGSRGAPIAQAVRAGSDWSNHGPTQEFTMPDTTPDSRVRANAIQSQGHTACPDKDGGEPAASGQTAAPAGLRGDSSPPLSDAELVQLRVRVIALENIVIALLAQSSERQLELAREMADHISPRPGFTTHPVTIHAAAEMNSLVRRAHAFRSGAYLPRDDAQTE